MSTVNKAIQELADKLKADGYAYSIIDDTILLVPRMKALDDHGLDAPQFLCTTLMEQQGAWSLIVQAKFRKVDESTPLYNLANTKAILEPIRDLMAKEYPHIDVQGSIPIEWGIEYDFENIIGEEKHRLAVVEGIFGMHTSTEDVYQLLLQLPKISEVSIDIETV